MARLFAWLTGEDVVSGRQLMTDATTQAWQQKEVAEGSDRAMDYDDYEIDYEAYDRTQSVRHWSTLREA